MLWPFRRNKAQALYNAAAQKARDPKFYTVMEVPDTLDGRFEMLCLITAIVMVRLSDFGKEGQRLSQDLFDKMFKTAEKSLREIGIGDMGIPKHMKRMMSGFNGRVNALDQALSGNVEKGKADIKKHLRRNLYSTNDDVDDAKIDEMADFVYLYKKALDKKELNSIRQGLLPDL